MKTSAYKHQDYEGLAAGWGCAHLLPEWEQDGVDLVHPGRAAGGMSMARPLQVRSQAARSRRRLRLCDCLEWGAPRQAGNRAAFTPRSGQWRDYAL